MLEHFVELFLQILIRLRRFLALCQKSGSADPLQC